MKKMSYVKRAIITAACIALCVVLPMAFHSVQNAGSIFCPMHIPVLLCGLLCGWPLGLRPCRTVNVQLDNRDAAYGDTAVHDGRVGSIWFNNRLYYAKGAYEKCICRPLYKFSQRVDYRKNHCRHCQSAYLFAWSIFNLCLGDRILRHLPARINYSVSAHTNACICPYEGKVYSGKIS